MTLRHLILLIGLLIIGFSSQELQAQGKPELSKYEYYVTDDGAFGLYKPKGWKVSTQKYPNGKMVFVSDPEDLSFANMIFLENIDPKLDSVAFAGATLRNVNQTFKEIGLILSVISPPTPLHFLRQCRKRKRLLNKPMGACIQDGLDWSVNGITAAHDHFQIRSCFHDKRVNPATVHIRQFYVQECKVNLAIKGLSKFNSLFPCLSLKHTISKPFQYLSEQLHQRLFVFNNKDGPLTRGQVNRRRSAASTALPSERLLGKRRGKGYLQIAARTWR